MLEDPRLHQDRVRVPRRDSYEKRPVLSATIHPDIKRTLVSISERTGMTVSQVADEVLYTGLIEMQEMDGEFMRMLQTLRDEMQGPLKVSSGLRCEDHNQMVSTSGRKGPHTLAKATDILISGERVMILFEKARQIGFSGSD